MFSCKITVLIELVNEVKAINSAFNWQEQIYTSKLYMYSKFVQ